MAELSVSRKTIESLLGDNAIQNRKFIIPDYQRPYKWDRERCETLWNDIIDFHKSISKEERSQISQKEYFLGTIVTCTNADKNLEVIDGQQRLTSLILLLRAYYKKLEDADVDNDAVKNLKNKIARCIWDVDPLDGSIKDRRSIRLKSLVITESDNNILEEIIVNGSTEKGDDSLYTKNYNYFLSKCEEYAKEETMDWQYLCLSILNNCILLPIECDNVESALTIFSTLNDRGLPLSDADIFKALIYKYKKDENDKNTFIEKWKELSEITDNQKYSIDKMFRYYSHVLRAREGNIDKEIEMRRFYTEYNNRRLLEDNLIDNLIILARFWKEIEEGDKNSLYTNDENKKWLHCLTLYPNEYWKYALSVFFIKNQGNAVNDYNEFQERLTHLFRPLVAYLYSKYITNPSVNNIRTDIYKYYRDIYANNNSTLQYEIPKKEDYTSRGRDGKTSKSLLLINTYLYTKSQESLLDKSIDLEHIFPKKWQDTNYNGWDEKDAQEYLEYFGNKIIFETRLNIQAGNGYFGKKKEKYKNSSIIEVKNELAGKEKDDWNKDDIIKREEAVIARLTAFFENPI